MTHLKKRIEKKSVISVDKIDDKFCFSIECVGTKYQVIFSSNIDYSNFDVKKIDNDLINILINGLLSTEDFVDNFLRIENREKSLRLLL